MTSPESKIQKSFSPKSNPQALNLGSMYSFSGSSQQTLAKYLLVGVFLIVIL